MSAVHTVRGLHRHHQITTPPRWALWKLIPLLVRRIRERRKLAELLWHLKAEVGVIGRPDPDGCERSLSQSPGGHSRVVGEGSGMDAAIGMRRTAWVG